MANKVVVIPNTIKQTGSNSFIVNWSDGHESRYETLDLRLRCPCASCVDEWTGEIRLDRSSIPKDVHPKKMESVGRYGIRVHWSDGHNTGIYTYDFLRKICTCSKCQEAVK